MPKLRVELDEPGQVVVVKDGEAQVGLTQLGVILDNAAQFVTLSRSVPGGFGTYTTCLDITKATITIEYTEEV